MKNNQIAIAVIVVIVVVGGLLILSQQQTTTEKTVKIGFIGPLSGDVASWGIADKEGVELSVEEINSQGGINGRKLDVIFEDDKCRQAETIPAAQKLISVDGVKFIVGTICSSTTLAIAPIVEQNKVVLISVGSSSPLITNAGDYVFRVWVSDALQGKVLAEKIFEDGYRKPAILYINNDYGIGVRDVFKQRFEELGGEIVAAETFEQESRDQRTQLIKIKAANSDNMLIIQNAEGGIIAKQAKELGLDLQLYGTETYGSEVVIDEGGEAHEGLIFSTPKFDESATIVADFLQKYKAHFNKDSGFAVVSAHAYDMMNVLAISMKNCENPENSTCVKNELYKIQNYPGVAGTLSFDSNGDVQKPFQFMVIRNSTAVKLT